MCVEMADSDSNQAASGPVHSQFPDTHSTDETSAIRRVPLQSCGNTRCNFFMSTPPPEAPVLSNLAQQLLRSGLGRK